jgi:hypothetical protein
MILLVPLWLICGVVAAILAAKRGNDGCLWLIIGSLLGPLGVLFAFTEGRKCPHCFEFIHQQATKCPKCQSAIAPSAPKPIPMQPIPQITPEQLEQMTARNKKTGAAIAVLMGIVILVIVGIGVITNTTEVKRSGRASVSVYRTVSGAPCTRADWDRQFLHGLKPGEEACKISVRGQESTGKGL